MANVVPIGFTIRDYFYFKDSDNSGPYVCDTSGNMTLVAGGGTGGGTSVAITSVAGASTATQTSVASSASSQTLIAANSSRKGPVIIQNDDVNTLYARLSATAATTTAYTAIIPTGGYFETPPVDGGPYKGAVTGIWTAAGSGAARITEFS